jgi:hypothetical protein
LDLVYKEAALLLDRPVFFCICGELFLLELPLFAMASFVFLPFDFFTADFYESE